MKRAAAAIAAPACASSGCRTKPIRRSPATWPPFSRAPRPSSRPITAPWSMTAGRRMIRPDLVLFNGGFFTPPVARERIAQALAGWFGEHPAVAGNRESRGGGRRRGGDLCPAACRRRPCRRPSSRREADARTTSLCGARRGAGAIAAVCVLARGTEEGTEQTFDHPFSVVTNRPVAFSLYSSTTRPDRAGDIVSLDPTWTRGNTRRSSPCSASGGSRVTSSCRSGCRSRSPKSARWRSGADRRRPNTAGGCSFRSASAAEEMDEAVERDADG